jgi:hypothetical protein
MLKEKNLNPKGENIKGVPVANSQLYQQPTKITGILTSQIRSKPSSDVPYMVYLRPESANTKHSLKECEAQKCQSCETPVIFR